MGEKGSARAVDPPLQGAHPQHQAHELQAHRRLPRAGGQLGLGHGTHQKRRPARVRYSPVRLHRRGHGGLRRRRGLVCHVDAAKGMVAWARENARSSGLEDAPIRWIVDDCAKFVEREIRRGRTYDAVIMDPPSYGRGPSGEIWKLEEDLFPFVELVAGVLSDSPLFFLINSYTTGLAPSGAHLPAGDPGGPPPRRAHRQPGAGPARHGHRPGPALRGVRPLDRPVKRSVLTL